ncbi:MAG: hypothetical protein OER04_04725 [Cyclobacteriaceae bacterium]|nr:hypothetical protein [Cyclobacteriaceae bacterium]
MKRTDKLFLKIAALASFSTVLTTFLLWLLPNFYHAHGSFSEGIDLAANPFYMGRLWVNFWHIPLALTAYFGFVYTLRNRELPKVSLGMIWFLIWGTVEMTGIAGIIFAVNNHWRSAFNSASATQQEVLRMQIENYLTNWDSWFFVLLVAFLLGMACFGWATWKGRGIEKTLSYLFWLAVPLTLLIILSKYLSLEWAGTVVAFTYPILQSVSRGLLGVYLWKNAKYDQY